MSNNKVKDFNLAFSKINNDLNDEEIIINNNEKEIDNNNY